MKGKIKKRNIDPCKWDVDDIPATLKWNHFWTPFLINDPVNKYEIQRSREFILFRRFN